MAEPTDKFLDEMADEDVGEYSPEPEDAKLVAEIDSKYSRWKAYRQPHESQWFTNAAMVAGKQDAVWSQIDQQLVVPPSARANKRTSVNLIFPKWRTRLAKFVRNRPMPVVIPASSDMDDRLDARATTRALEFTYRKQQMERKYQDAVLAAGITGHGYWWFHWNPNALGRVKLQDEMGKEKIETGVVGDVEIEVDSAFSILVADPSITYIGDQPEIMRVKTRTLAHVRERYPNGVFVKGETKSGSGGTDQESKIASMSPTSMGVSSESGGGKAKYALVKEWFKAPDDKYPFGRSVVTAGGVLLKRSDELPHGFADMLNPYPVVDFPDVAAFGQYWNTTVVEQMIPPQQEFNNARTALAKHLRKCIHPKVLVAQQQQLAEGAWTDAAGEVVVYTAHPSIPPPMPWVPPPISADVWRSIELSKRDIEDVSHIFSESEGRVGQAKSGFQTNLLQEATDQVHAPDLRNHERAMEDAYYKIRRMMKRGYDVPRLMSIAGKSMQPEVLEFSANEIDEYADIVVQSGSALPMMKGAKIQAVLEMYNMGLLGNQQDPETKRRALAMLELGTNEDAYDFARRDEDMARIENDEASKGVLQHQPEPWENHDIHYRTHTDCLKGGETRGWGEGRQMLVAHVIFHVKYQNPMAAIELAGRLGMPELVQDLVAKQQAMQAAQMQPPQAPPPGPPQMPGEAKPIQNAASGANQAVPEGGFGPQGGEPMLV